MKDFLKKTSIAAYLIAGSAIISLVAMIIAAVSSSEEGLGMVELPGVIVLSIASLLLAAGIVYLSYKKGDNFIITILVLAMVFAGVFCIYCMIFGKMQVFGTVIFSDLEKGYAPAERACWLGVTSIVMYIVATLVTVVSAFLKFSTKEHVQVKAE